MPPSLAPMFEIATDKALPKTLHKAEMVINGLLVVAESQCQQRASELASNFVGAMEHSASHVAREVSIADIAAAQKDGCAASIRVFANS